MAFILIQHLDPTHESMMVDLLAGHTPMTVQQAADGMPIEPEHVYVIPPGSYLSIRRWRPAPFAAARASWRAHALRLLPALAGGRASASAPICVILSGTGADGSLGLKAIKERAGSSSRRIRRGRLRRHAAQRDHDRRRRSRAAGGGDPGRLAKYAGRMFAAAAASTTAPRPAAERLAEIIELLRTKASHDFALYKPGTLQRRIERRMALAAIDRRQPVSRSAARGCRRARPPRQGPAHQRHQLFPRPQGLRAAGGEGHSRSRAPAAADRPLRIWVAGCSTGEETYTLAMLFLEEIAAAKRNIKLQVFASDVDEDAVALAREGRYPESIAADVSPARLARFFTKEEHGYRVVPELRGVVVFTVQDVLADPPFSRLDLISCRNLLIYLRPEAQAEGSSAVPFRAARGRHPVARRLRDGGQSR